MAIPREQKRDRQLKCAVLCADLRCGPALSSPPVVTRRRSFYSAGQAWDFRGGADEGRTKGCVGALRAGRHGDPVFPHGLRWMADSRMKCGGGPGGRIQIGFGGTGKRDRQAFAPPRPRRPGCVQ